MAKKALALLMAVTLAAVSVFTAAPAYANAAEGIVYRDDASYLIEKISNPTAGSGQADGLVPGGDRENSYAWSMQELSDEYGDYIYIGSNRNILYASLGSLVNTGGVDAEMVKSLVDLITNGELETDTNQLSFAQAVIVRYNVKTGTMETYFNAADHGFTGDYALVSGFRAAMLFKDDIYFNANCSGKSAIWRISDNNQALPEVVYSQPGGYMRAMTVSQDGQTMYVGGTDINQSNIQGTVKINVCATTNGTDFELIADYKDFTQYEQEGYFGSGGDVWDIVEYNGSLYFTLMTNHGAIVYEAHKASPEEADIANEYGWVWTDIVGETENSIYEPGFGNVLNYAASPYIFNDDLYFITFSNAMDSIIYGAGGLISMLGSEQPDMQTFFDSLKMMDANFDNETSIFRMKPDGSVQMVMGDSELCPDNIQYVAKLGAGFNDADYSTTQYNWRAAVYGGKLYIGTFDSYAMSKYVTKLTNGDLFEMDDEEFKLQLQYAAQFLEYITGGQETAATYSLRKDAVLQDVELAADVYQLLMNQSAAPVTYAAPKADTPDVPSASVDAEMMESLMDALLYIHDNLDGKALTDTVSQILNNIVVHEDTVENMAQDLDRLVAYLEKLNASVQDESISEAISALETVLSFFRSIMGVFENVDQAGVSCYVRISDTIAANDLPGFEIYCTEDGVNYETITLDGFHDEYNYGCRTFLVGSNGLYVGTANPFFGGQLWRINEKTLVAEKFVSNIDSITQAFAQDQLTYEAEVSYETEQFTFTFKPADHGNTIYLNGTALDGWDGEAALQVGENTIAIVNETVDGSDSVAYTFTITRLEKQSDDSEVPGEGETPDDGEKPGEGETPDDGEKPGEGETPDDGEKPGTDSPAGGNSPTTGDPTNLTLYVLLFVVSGLLMAAFVAVSRKKRA